jgi:hypothetical protein
MRIAINDMRRATKFAQRSGVEGFMAFFAE